MLVISRRKGERILIGPDIEIVLLEVGRGGVRLGITAPPAVVVHRAEPSGATEATLRCATHDAPLVNLAFFSCGCRHHPQPAPADPAPE